MKYRILPPYTPRTHSGRARLRPPRRVADCVSGRSWIQCIVAAAVTFTVTSAQGTNQLPDLGDYSATVVSASEEEALGREFMRDARRRLVFLDDPEIDDYLNRLGRKLAANSDDPGMEFSFYLIKDSTLNAFAVPGGHIAMHTGLVLATQHESELASVLAHEIAHLTQRHLPRMIAAMKKQTIPMTAAIIAAILLGGQAGQAALAATNAAALERQLTYSREFEAEADAIGIRALARTGFDPRSMPVFFERMQQWARIQESDAPEFLRTHPLTTNRIAESLSRAERYPRVELQDENMFLHMRAKIRALYNDKAEHAVQFFESALRDARNPAPHVERYGYALALMASSQYDRARAEIRELVKLRPHEPQYQIAEAEIELKAGNYDAALRRYREAKQQHPDRVFLDYYLASALLKTGHPQEAKDTIRRVLLTNRTEPRLYQVLARAEGDLGNSLGAHQALAEYHFQVGNSREALRQLHLARNYAGDSFYASASIDARIEEIEQRLRALGEKVPPRSP